MSGPITQSDRTKQFILEQKRATAALTRTKQSQSLRLVARLAVLPRTPVTQAALEAAVAARHAALARDSDVIIPDALLGVAAPRVVAGVTIDEVLSTLARLKAEFAAQPIRSTKMRLHDYLLRVVGHVALIELVDEKVDEEQIAAAALKIVQRELAIDHMRWFDSGTLLQRMREMLKKAAASEQSDAFATVAVAMQIVVDQVPLDLHHLPLSAYSV